MGIKKIIILIVSTFLSSCVNESKKADIKAIPEIDSVPKTVPVSNAQKLNTDTFIVNSKAAVFIAPDSVEIEKRKKEIGEEDFYAGADDFIFYMNNANSFLQKQKLPILDTEGKKIIKFIKADKTYTVISTDTLPALWNIYLFDAKQAPLNASLTAIEDEYKNYYK